MTLRHVSSMILLFAIAIAIVCSSGLACGIGSSGRSGQSGSGTGTGQTGPIDDVGVLFNQELPGTNLQAGETSQFVTISALGRSMIVFDSVTEDNSINIDNSLKFNNNQNGENQQ